MSKDFKSSNVNSEIDSLLNKLKENEETIKSLINGITDPMLLVDLDGRIILANEAVAYLMGQPSQKLIGQIMFDGLPEKMIGTSKDYMAKVVKRGIPERFEDEMDGKNYRHCFFPVFNSQCKVTKIAVLSSDITESKRIEAAFKDSEERFRNVFENTASGMALVSLDGHYFLVNEALCNILGYSAEELSNMSLHDIIHPEDLNEEIQMTQELVNDKIKNYQYEKRYVHKDGSIVWVLQTNSLVKDSNKKPFYMIGQIQNITLQKQAEEALKQATLEAEKARRQAEDARELAEEARLKAELLSRTDYLTGLLNRRAFMDRLLEEANRTKRNKSTLTLILTDIDFFKKINDTYGHLAGDTVLQAFSNCLNDMSRPYDFIGRYGGEEFVICLPDVSLENGKMIAERMRVAVEGLKIYLPDTNRVVNITASFGVSTSTLNKVSQMEKLIECADEAMYNAKQQGRNRVIAEACDLDFTP